MARKISLEEWERIYGSEDSWFSKGSHLIEAANHLLEWAGRDKFSEKFNVGEDVAHQGEELHWAQHKRWVIGQMMLSFAVENWLKGLRAAQQLRLSSKQYKAIQSELDKIVEKDDESYIESILVALDGPLRGKMGAYNKEVAKENAARRLALLKYNHDLVALARDCKLPLGKKETVYLEALKQVNQLGRYPALGKNEPVRHLTLVLGRQQLRDSVSRMVRECYDTALGLKFDRLLDN